MSKPHIIIHVGGGCLRGVLSNVPVDYTLLDYDVQDGDTVKVPDEHGDTEEAYASTDTADVSQDLHAAILKAIKSK